MNLAENEIALPVRTFAPSAAREIPAWWHGAKRCIDVIVACVALLLTAPVLIAAALAIVAVSPGSPIFVQERVGKNGRRFRMYKLRTMVRGAHLLHEDVRHLSEVSGPVLKIRNDPRLHAVGAFLRRTSIDELPNFLNVLLGDMSVVGPRPPLPCEVERYCSGARRRLTVKPGVTCLWQISGRSRVSFDEWILLDARYVDEWTPWSDLAIIARTIPAVIRADGAC